MPSLKNEHAILTVLAPLLNNSDSALKDLLYGLHSLMNGSQDQFRRGSIRKFGPYLGLIKNNNRMKTVINLLKG